MLRKKVAFIEKDEVMYGTIEKINQMIHSEEILSPVEASVGPLY